MIFLLSNITSPLIAQVSKQRDFIIPLEGTYKQNQHKHNWSSYLKNVKNEGEFAFSLLFLTYKTFFSSQDIDACAFAPSCSVYMIETIQRNGIYYGLPDGLDRVMRCHPFANGQFVCDHAPIRTGPGCSRALIRSLMPRISPAPPSFRLA